MSKRTLSLGLFSLFALSLQLFATTLLYKNFDDLIKESDGIVSARVAGIQSMQSPREIYTFVTLDQIDVIAGNYSEPTLSLRFFGGQVGNQIEGVEGGPEFEVNQRVLLFIRGNGRSLIPLVGWTQGLFRIVQDTSTGQDVVQDYEGNAVVGIRAGRIIKDQSIEPEAHIVSRQSGLGIATSNDFADPSAHGSVAGPSSRIPPPAMTSQAFRDAVTSAASQASHLGQLHSVALGDFSVPNNSPHSGVAAPPAGSENPAAPPVLPKKRTMRNTVKQG